MILSLLLSALFACACLHQPPVTLVESDFDVMPSNSIQVDYSDTTFMPEYIDVFDLQGYYRTHQFEQTYYETIVYDEDSGWDPVLGMMYLPYGFGVEFYGWGTGEVCYFRITQVDFVVIPYAVVDTWHSYYFYPSSTNTANRYRLREYNGTFLREKGYSSLVIGYSSQESMSYTSTSLYDFYSQTYITTTGGFTFNCQAVCESFENFLYNRFYRLLKSSASEYFQQGNRLGYEEGHQDGYNDGYSAGMSIGSNPASTLNGLFSTIIAVPMQILNGFNAFVIWETPVTALLVSFAVMGIMLWLIKRFIR